MILQEGPSSGEKSYDEITVFKKGSGAHLDLMIGRYISGEICQPPNVPELTPWP